MFLLPILSLLGFIFVIKRMSRWSIELIPFFAVSAITAVMYLLGLLHLLVFGTLVLVFLGLLAFLLSPWFIKGERWALEYLTPGFLFLVLFALFFGTFAAHSHFHLWDEFAQWGARAKLVALLHNYSAPAHVLARPDFPPGTALFYYWMLMFSDYSEGLVHLAHQLLILLPLGILVKDYSWERWQKAFLVLCFAVSILLLLHVRMASNITIYVDGVVGVYFGAMVLLYYYSERKISDVLFLIAPVFFFVLIKLYLLPFVLLLAVLMLVDSHRRKLEKKNMISHLMAVALLVVVALIVCASWHMYLVWNNIPMLSHFQRLPSWHFSKTQTDLIGHYSWALFKHLPFVVVIMMLSAVSIIMSYRQGKKQGILLFHSMMFLGFLTYIVVLLSMFLYQFGPNEVSRLVSLDRYLKVYDVAWGLFAFGSFLSEWSDSKIGQNQMVSGSLIAAALIAFPTYLFVSYYHHMLNDQRRDGLWRLRHSLAPLIKIVKEEVPASARLFIVWQEAAGFERVVLSYELMPREINPQPSSFGDPYAKRDIWTKDYSKEQLKKEINTYDYVLLAYTDRTFWRRYRAVFKNSKQHRLVEYLVCRRSEFDSFGKKGCWMQAATAYLFKN